MEKNPNFTKEEADFIFNKINNYYKQRAYKQTLSEISRNKELIGSSLNIGSQLKLNKIYTDCLVHVILDSFEVDGNLAEFNQLMSKNHTTLELHADSETFNLLTTYINQKERHPNYKSRKEYFNQNVEPDTSTYVSHKKTSNDKEMTKPLESDIGKDFLDSIESPSFHYAPLGDDEKVEGKVLKSNVDVKAIHDDFFDAIMSPETSSKNSKEFKKQNPFADEKKKREEKEKKIKGLAKANEKKNSSIKDKIEIIEDGKKITQIIHKSGGKVTEYTLDDPSPEIRPEAPIKRKKPEGRAKKEVFETRKESIQTPKDSRPNKYDSKVSLKDREINQDPRLLPDEANGDALQIKPVFILVVLVLALGLIYGGYKVIHQIKGPQSAQVPAATDTLPDDNSSSDEDHPEPEDEVEEIIVEEPKYLLPSDEREITEADFEGMSKADVRIAINEMFARYGWSFGGSGELYDYFSSKDWYEPDPSLTSANQAEQQFSPLERKNLQVILAKFQSL